ncbi:MAG: hypothetical protein H5T69_14535, partial [Chloroflexi bacterium]|nr:hypothetical protein [Chloroflexota bacterium]
MTEQLREPMTFREMTLRIFAGQPVPHVLWQPRMEPWFDWHKQFKRLSPPWRDQTVTEFYDALGCSMRYIHYYTGSP